MAHYTWDGGGEDAEAQAEVEAEGGLDPAL